MSRTPLPSHILSISHAKLTLFIPVGDAVFFPYRANGLPATASFWLGGAMGLSAVSEAGGRYARLRRAGAGAAGQRERRSGERRERITACFLGIANVKECSMFPRDINRVAP